MIEVGRVCMKTAGRESGKFCVIADVLPDGMVLVTGPKAVTGIKRRNCSIHHVEPTPLLVKMKKNAPDEEIIAAYKHAGVFQKIGVKEPGAKEIEASKEAERKRALEAKHVHKAEEAEKPAEEAHEHKKAEHHEKPAHHEHKAEKAEAHAHVKKAAVKKPAKKKAEEKA